MGSRAKNERLIGGYRSTKRKGWLGKEQGEAKRRDSKKQLGAAGGPRRKCETRNEGDTRGKTSECSVILPLREWTVCAKKAKREKKKRGTTNACSRRRERNPRKQDRCFGCCGKHTGKEKLGDATEEKRRGKGRKRKKEEKETRERGGGMRSKEKRRRDKTGVRGMERSGKDKELGQAEKGKAGRRRGILGDRGVGRRQKRARMRVGKAGRKSGGLRLRRRGSEYAVLSEN